MISKAKSIDEKSCCKRFTNAIEGFISTDSMSKISSEAIDNYQPEMRNLCSANALIRSSIKKINEFWFLMMKVTVNASNWQP